MATIFNNNPQVVEDDLVKCGICSCEYDEIKRKPKLLECSHTVCLICLQDQKKTAGNCNITCPICPNNCSTIKDDIDSLPTNMYVLQILKYKNQAKRLAESTLIHSFGAKWCLTCGASGRADCVLSGHLSVDSKTLGTADTIKNLESFLNLKERLMLMKDESSNKIALAIEKRREVQQQITVTMKSVTEVYSQLKKVQEENDLELTHLISIESKKSKDTNISNVQVKQEKTDFEEKDNQQQETVDKSIVEFMNLVADTSPGDTAEMLKIKMNKSFELCQKKFSEALALASEFDLRQKIKISIRLNDENGQPIPTCSLLEEGFRYLSPASASLNSPLVQQDLTLISFAIFNFLKRLNIELKSIPQTRSSGDLTRTVSALTEMNGYPSQTNRDLAPVLSAHARMPSSNEYIPGHSTFILRLFKSSTPSGEVHIRPIPTFSNPEFVKQLGDVCFKSPKYFGNAIEKTVPAVYVLLSVVGNGNQPIPKMVLESKKQKPYTKLADHPGSVGLMLNNSHWNGFLFPLKQFKKHDTKMLTAEVFGIVTNKQKVINKLSTISVAERSQYSMSLESV